jgi:hypothetical protein
MVPYLIWKMPRRNYQWDPSAARFRDPDTGRYISRSQVRRAVDDLIRASQQRITAVSDQVRAGQITTSEWNAIMRQEIKRVLLGKEALLRGGWAQMTAEDFGRVGKEVRTQYQYLDGFLHDLEAGKVRTDGTFMERARSYAESARVAYYEALAKQLPALGYTQERNKLHPAEHCVDCVDMAALGWVPIGTCIPIGQRKCINKDKCEMLYR